MKLPYITDDLAGCGGEIKAEPEHFVVSEVPLYAASGQGEHVYLTITRRGRATRDLANDLARLAGVAPGAIGYAGLKDKQAVATQSFSIHLPPDGPEELARRVEAELGCTVSSASRHTNKLRKGHLLGNRFSVLISGAGPDAAERARAVCEAIAARGLPNFFGAQRFGREGDNAMRGRDMLLGGRGPRQRFLRELLLSAWQAEAFNRWLAARMAAGDFVRLMEGDVAKKLATGGMFTVEDAGAEAPRLASWEITYTGPMFGAKMRPAAGEAGEREAAFLAAEGVDARALKKARLPGSRRAARLPLENVEIEPEGDGLWLRFLLPKGSYATTVLREVIKPPEDGGPQD